MTRRLLVGVILIIVLGISVGVLSLVDYGSEGAQSVSGLGDITARTAGSLTNSSRSTGVLRWPAPQLVGPTTITVGEGYAELHLDPLRDYIIRLPRIDKIGGLTLNGGHNIVLIGGHITLPSGIAPGKISDKYRSGLYVKGATGVVHIEGVLFDAAPEDMWDGIDINAPLAIVQLENLRLLGIKGTYYGFHGDVVQPWGGVKDLRIDRLSATSDDQGLTIPIDLGPIGSAELSHVDLRGFGGEAQKGGQLIWLTTGIESCQAYPVQLTDVYIKPRSRRNLDDSVWPQQNLPNACRARVARRSVVWPRLPEVRGRVTAGIPRGGPYVPANVAGTGYISPG